MRQILERIRTGGAVSIRYNVIGQPSNNWIIEGVRDYAMALVRERYADFGLTLATEKLTERDGLWVLRETVRGWISSAGLWLSRKQRRTFRQPRLRREAYGDMLADIKERQDQQAKPTIKSNSDKNGYVKHARRPGRRKDIMSDPTVIAE